LSSDLNVIYRLTDLMVYFIANAIFLTLQHSASNTHSLSVYLLSCSLSLGPGKTTYMFSVTFCFPLRPFSVLPAGGGGWVRRGGGGSGGRNGKYVGVSGKCIR
jgi:hypothetical protein